MHTAAESSPPEGRAFVRRALTRLGGPFLAFAAIHLAAVLIIPAGDLSETMRQAPLAPALIAASLIAAWLARWWAETEQPALVALWLHAATQALLLAPLTGAVGWPPALFLSLVAVALTLAGVPAAARFYRADQFDAAALALSAAPAGPFRCAVRFVRCLGCRD